MFERFAAFVTRYWWAMILGWIVVAWGANQVAPVWDEVTLDGDIVYMPGEMTTVRGLATLAQAFPDNKAKSQIALVVERPGRALTGDDRVFVGRLAEVFERLVAADPAVAWTDRQRFEAKTAFATLVGAKPDTLSPPQAEVFDELAAAFRPAPPAVAPLVEVWDRGTEVVGDKLTSGVSKAGQASLVLLHLNSEFMATTNMKVLDAVCDTLALAETSPGAPAGLTLGVTGSAAIGADTLNSAHESITNIELTTVVLVLAILLFVYRAPLLVLVTLATMVVSVMVAIDVVATLTQVSWLDFHIFKTTRIFVIVILFGAGTDYCLFLIARYREELARGLDKDQAVTRALAQVGDAVVASALTVVVGLGMMYFASFGKFRYSGPAIAMCLAVCLVACLTLTPALLKAMGTAVFWPWGLGKIRNRNLAPVDELPIDETDPGSRFWNWASRVMLKHPGKILATCVLVMAPFAWVGRDVPISYDLLTDLGRERPSVRGTALLRKHFAPGDIGPVTVVAVHEGTNFDSPEGKRKIAELSNKLAAVAGIIKVRSFTQPTGDPPKRHGLTPKGFRKATTKVHPRTRAAYITQVPRLAGCVTRFDLVFASDPFSKESIALLDRIAAQLKDVSADKSSTWYGAVFDFVGTTSGIRDLQAVVTSDTSLIQHLVVIAVLAVLLVLIRRPLLCVYLIVSVVFSYMVTIGATELVFGWLYGATYSGLDWKAPLFLFVILIAVGEDYNIFLTTRIMEEQRRHGPIEGLRQATIRTGGIITSCGLIMAGSFMSMLTGTLRGMLELGFALSLGVLLDTFVVRPVLVPCFLALVYRIRGEDEAATPALAGPAVVAHVGANGHSGEPHAGTSDRRRHASQHAGTG